ncbi:MAG: UDP-N-acetylmuramoyl-L-alanyl-D-glutamate--2,6-diaminopimelate ligase [Bacteroidia bacterium]|nr:UDP-N-acetylmuramoyl-L-alanyl-D-glutamate--2,6-diaminopimelate ligase [Bacteroidia bacterium]
MKTLKQLIATLDSAEVYGAVDVRVENLQIDSRAVTADTLYAAMQGTTVDGHTFIDGCIDAGASAILCSTLPVALRDGVAYVLVNNVAKALGEICLNFYDRKAEKITIVGTTGTNGKTSVSTLLFDLFTFRGHLCGLISTVENRIGKDIIPSTHTTPNIVALHGLLAQMADAGCSHCFMEVSSHAVDQRRIAGVPFTAGVFTNLTHDHLDYHKTFDNYLKAKKQFFDELPGDAFAVTNKDDRNGMVMLQNTKAMRYTYAMKQPADFTVRVSEHDFTGMQLQLNQTEFWTPLIGGFNAYNLCAVYATAFLLTEGDPVLPIQMSALGKVNGRFEVLRGPNRITAIVDYAHTPDALKNVLQTINEIRKNSVNLITVVGCGGNRDQAKRPEMGKLAAELSNRAILTSDNPRFEDPQDILSQMEAGVEPQHYKRIVKITDRKEAIKTAVLMAQTGDIILVAGKGHETYQDVQGVKHPFDDKQILSETFKLIE